MVSRASGSTSHVVSSVVGTGWWSDGRPAFRSHPSAPPPPHLRACLMGPQSICLLSFCPPPDKVSVLSPSNHSLNLSLQSQGSSMLPSTHRRKPKCCHEAVWMGPPPAPSFPPPPAGRPHTSDSLHKVLSGCSAVSCPLPEH